MGVRDLGLGNCVWAPSCPVPFSEISEGNCKTGKELRQDTIAHEKTLGPPRVSVLSNEATTLAKKGLKHGE